MSDLWFQDAEGQAFCVTNAPADYTREGATLIDPPPSPEHRWIDGEWQIPPASPPTNDLVIAERERRLAMGFDYDFGDERGTHHIGTTPEDIRKWNDEVTPLANALMLLGIPEGTINIRTNTGPATITAQEWLQILVAAGEWRQPIYQASFDLMGMDPIPADYTDDKWWTPAAPENE